MAIASAKNSAGHYNVYVSSLNLASVNVATSLDNGSTFTQTPVQAGLPLDDREWIAAYGASTSLLTYHDIASSEIDVLRSDNSGALYHQISQAIAPTSIAATNNELGNLVIDHHNLPKTGGFFAYQSFVAPSSSSGTWVFSALPSSSTTPCAHGKIASVGCGANSQIAWPLWRVLCLSGLSSHGTCCTGV